jgi:DNA-binding transcriptional MocR family regulator
MVLQTQEKVTVVLPKNLKQEVEELKKTLKISMNSIYQLAIAEYIEKKKRESLRAEAKSMIQEYRLDSELLELSSLQEDINEY